MEPTQPAPEQSSANGPTVEAALAAPASSGGYLIAEARLRQDLTQAELARRLGTSQSLVARWETGRVAPSFNSVVRAVRACGLELGVGLFSYDADHDRLISDQLALTPQQRAQTMARRVASLNRLRSGAEVIDE